ncbi:MAG: hypothetical protein IJ224_09055 [Lachnospiraceae bacterium]|nr:hypothetical protein [Lachnospiraceae bacterium]
MRNRITVTIFILYILVFAVGSIIAKDRIFSDMENRNLAQFPEVSAKSVFSGDFSDGFEEYMSDQIIFKDFLVKLKVTENKALNQTYVNSIYFADGRYIRDYKENTALIDKNVGFVNEFAEANPDFNITWLMVPNACYVYEDSMPSYADVDSQAATIGHIKDYVSDKIDFVDVSDELVSAKDDYIYYKTDHHWTMNGAYIGYKKLCEALGREPVEKDTYKIEVVRDDFLGTLYSDAPVFNADTDEIILYVNENNSYTVDYIDKGFKQDSLYNYEKLDIKDKYQVYLDGNHAIIRIRNNSYLDANKDNNKDDDSESNSIAEIDYEVSDNITSANRVIIVKDSYAHSLLPLLADNYEEIIVVDLRYYHEKTVSELAHEEGISDIIFINNVDFINSDDNFLWLM